MGHALNARRSTYWRVLAGVTLGGGVVCLSLPVLAHADGIPLAGPLWLGAGVGMLLSKRFVRSAWAAVFVTVTACLAAAVAYDLSVAPSRALSCIMLGELLFVFTVAAVAASVKGGAVLVVSGGALPLVAGGAVPSSYNEAPMGVAMMLLGVGATLALCSVILRGSREAVVPDEDP